MHLKFSTPNTSQTTNKRTTIFHSTIMEETGINFQLDVELVHRILCCDPSDFTSLTPEVKSATPEYDDFRQNLLEGSDPASIMKRAYYDGLCDTTDHEKAKISLNNLLLELHTAIRSLVPHRQDLHSLLNDQRALPDIPMEMLPWIIQAAQALTQLESEVRAESTHSWIRQAQNASLTAGSTSKEQISFLVTSIMYLLFKVESCEQDKQSFYLTQVLAPRLYTTGKGIDLERKALKERFGSNLPITTAWIKSLVKEDQKKSLTESREARQSLIRVGWIEDILFQKNRQTIIPEIFLLDVKNLQSIRQTTRLAAAGCALGLHVCTAVKCNPEVLLKDESRGIALVKAMGNRSHGSIDKYEEGVEDACMSLARVWKDGPLDDREQQILKGRTRSVLRGDDPVIQLLDNRIKELFVAVTSSEVLSFPVKARAGIQALPTHTKESPFLQRARQKFQDRGLGFYSLDLAHGAQLAFFVADLAWTLYADEFLDKIILDACQSG
jgi:hypothetical protein